MSSMCYAEKWAALSPMNGGGDRHDRCQVVKKEPFDIVLSLLFFYPTTVMAVTLVGHNKGIGKEPPVKPDVGLTAVTPAGTQAEQKEDKEEQKEEE